MQGRCECRSSLQRARERVKRARRHKVREKFVRHGTAAHPVVTEVKTNIATRTKVLVPDNGCAGALSRRDVRAQGIVVAVLRNVADPVDGGRGQLAEISRRASVAAGPDYGLNSHAPWQCLVAALLHDLKVSDLVDASQTRVETQDEKAREGDGETPKVREIVPLDSEMK